MLSQAKADELAPYVMETVVPVAAAVTIQSTWRSYVARCRTVPSIATRLIIRRSAICIQRWWKMQLFKMRFLQLEVLRRQVSFCRQSQVFTLIISRLLLNHSSALCPCALCNASDANDEAFPKLRGCDDCWKLSSNGSIFSWPSEQCWAPSHFTGAKTVIWFWSQRKHCSCWASSRCGSIIA